MRAVAGAWRGRGLVAPAGDTLAAAGRAVPAAAAGSAVRGGSGAARGGGARVGRVAPGALVVAELARAETLPDLGALLAERMHGAARVAVWRGAG